MGDEIRITLLRHGRSRADDEHVHEGRYDSPLTDVGRAQAEKRGNDFKVQGFGYKLIIASPLQRAQETARILSKHLGIPVETDMGWAEMDNGLLAGLSFDEASNLYPKPSFRSPYEPIGVKGESEWGLYNRAGRAVEKIVQRGPGQYLVVAHGGILNAALRTIFGVVPWGNNQGTTFSFRDLGYVRLFYLPKEHRWVVDEFRSD